MKLECVAPIGEHAICEQHSHGVAVQDINLDEEEAMNRIATCTERLSGTAAEVFIRCLEAEGVEYIFGIPGEENLDLLDAIEKAGRIKLVLCRHEQAAGFMAAVVGRLTGSIGVCLSTLGPGATNFSTAVAYAQLGGMPMLVITGQKPIRHSKQGQFQIVDVVNHFKPLTKFTKQIPEPDLVASLIRSCARIAIEEKPGPVHLELPEDIAGMSLSSRAYLYPRNHIWRPIAENKAIFYAAKLLMKARTPLICIGAGANRKNTQKVLRAFLQKAGIYVVCTQMGKGVVDESSPYFLGCAALSDNDLVHCAVRNADVIVNIGHDSVEKPPFYMSLEGLPVVIHVNFYAAVVDEVYYPHHEVVGDIANALWRLKECLEPTNAFWDFSAFKLVRQYIHDKIHKSPHVESDAYPMTIQRVVADVRHVMPDDGILCLDNGMYKIWFARQYLAKMPNTVLLDNALATMGAGLPSAIAAKLVLRQGIKVLAVCGDGGFMMNSQELETAVRLNLHIVILILNDNAFGMIRWKQAACGYNNFGMDCSNPDFAAYARAYGARGHLVKFAGDLKDTLQQCLTEHGVHVIEVPVNYDTSDSALVHENTMQCKELEHAIEVLKTEKQFRVLDTPKALSVNVTDEAPVLSSHPMTWPMFMGGKPVQPNADLAVRNCYTGEIVARVAQASKEHIGSAIQMAADSTKKMAALSSYQRKEILLYCVAKFRDRFKEFAHVLCVEGGKPITDAKGEVLRLIDTFEIASEEVIRSLAGDFQNMDISQRNSRLQQITKRVPIGPVSMISPFNFPLNLAAHKIAPAIAAGCPFVLKPASLTPLGALMIGEVLAEAPHLPAGSFSILPCRRDAAELFTVDERFKLLSFTGSPQVGWEMKTKCGKKKVVLELGGNAACIVDEIPREGLEYLLDRIVFGAYYQSGQSCISLQRLLIKDSLYSTIVPALAQRVRDLVLGDPRNQETFCGPMITSGEAQRLRSWILAALEGGARLLGGSPSAPSGPMGNMLVPTLLDEIPHECDVWNEEAFGPVLCIKPYIDFNAALEEVNNSRFGIHAGIFSTDITKIWRAFDVLEVGGVVVGDVPSIRVDAMPYGGVKDSGIGREGIKYAIEDMTEIRAMLMKNIG